MVLTGAAHDSKIEVTERLKRKRLAFRFESKSKESIT